MALIATLTMNPALDITTSVAEVKHTHKLRCAEPRFDPGGGGINVARVVHELGGAVTAIFPRGGASSSVLEQLLRDSGVPITPVDISGVTRESFTVDETSTDLQYRFVLPGPTLGHAERQRVLDTLAGLPEPAAYVVASGSLPPGCPPDIYRELAERCRTIGARLVIDTSGPALAACEGVGAFLLKPSHSELVALAGRPLPTETDQIAAAHELLDRGFAEVIVASLGERGALLVTRDVARSFPAIEVPVESAVGAGDSMVAAVVLALSGGGSLIEAVRRGIAAGSAAMLSAGTGLATRADVERLYAALPPV
jgi:6-phosphofructokinase 2